jgi:hypothetical protein
MEPHKDRDIGFSTSIEENPSPTFFKDVLEYKDFNNHPEILDQYLPWSSELPEECRLNHNYRKCLEK